MTYKRLAVPVVALLLLLSGVAGASVRGPAPLHTSQANTSLGTAFTYQGRLTSGGAPANGSYDFEFRLYDAETRGRQMGNTVAIDNVVVTDGLFSVVLDFGAAVFTGEARYLEIGVRPGNSASAYTTLTPRQALMPTPYALALPGLYAQPNDVSPNLIGGHSDNSVAAGAYGATISGGGESSAPNLATHDLATIGGGAGNQAGAGATIAGGVNNVASAQYTTVSGGFSNVAGSERRGDQTGIASTIGGGTDNQATGDAATIGGGSGNRASGTYTTIAGGWDNEAFGEYSTIAGGQRNHAAYDFATVGGGQENLADEHFATVSGGENNEAGAEHAVVAGGEHNQALAPHTVVGGGQANVADNRFSTVAGGQSNTASDEYATISGGATNEASGQYTVISGGRNNIASRDYASIAGGQTNQATGQWSAIGGGGANEAGGQYATVAGGQNNAASGAHAVIGGGEANEAGDEHATVAGGEDNLALDEHTTIGGGQENVASSPFATVAGGHANTASNDYATVGGGGANEASGDFATVSGGQSNQASGQYATVAGGQDNTAEGDYSFAAGRRAKIRRDHSGSFLFADANNVDFRSEVSNEFAVRATGGVRFVTAINSSGQRTAGVELSTGASAWSTLSDRNAKANFAPVDEREIVARLAAIPIQTWNYKAQAPSIRHIGPVAQDFYAAFGVGEDERHISTVDADGVALAAIQGLYQMLQAKDAEIAAQQEQIAALEARLAALEQTAGMAGPAGSAQAMRHTTAPASLSTWLLLGGFFLIGLMLVERWRAGGRQ
ncbi:MAG: hypothetical protein D6791_12080 [Chloroflexi bacterium]|nr:MAG: hypothetical protein D6791_12080 [Chloroflexota bacterium]